MRYVHKKHIILLLVIVTVVFLLNFLNNEDQFFECISNEFILKNVHQETTKNYTVNAIIECDYHDILNDGTVLSPVLVDEDLSESHKIREGGEYLPLECISRFSVAIIVPFRDMVEQLRGFLVFMHMFLHHQKIHYRIYVIEQVDSKPFNRAKLMNVGAAIAMKAGYPCLILHDVDLLPLKLANLYACMKQPRHMSSSIDGNTFRLTMVKPNKLGGAIAILAKQYRDVNGMSNEYYGLFGENDDFYNRLVSHNYSLCRFQEELGRYYTMELGTPERMKYGGNLLQSSKSSLLDGLNSLKYTEVANILHPLFTHIMVDL